MNSKPFNTKRAVVVLIVAIIGYLLFLWLGWYVMNEFLLPKPMQPFHFNVWALVFPLMVVVEIFIYRWLGDKHIIRRYANLHIGSVILKMIIFPCFSSLLAVMMVNHMSLSELRLVGVPVSRAIIWGGHIIFITGHVFLILLILKRNSYPVKENTGDDSRDHLHEFAE